MNCPNQGKLLMYLEGALDYKENTIIHEHLASCTRCSQELNELQEDLNFTREKLLSLVNSYKQADVAGQDRLWNIIRRNLTSYRKGIIMIKLKKLAIAAVIVLSIGLVGSMPAVQTMAANFLQVFRVQQVDTIAISPTDMAKIERSLTQGNQRLDIENFGKMEAKGKHQRQELQEDELQQLGFSVKLPALLASDKVEYNLDKYPVMEITPKAEKVNDLLAELGSQYKLPEALDGQVCRITMGDALVSSYENKIVFVQASVPQVEVPTGVDVQEVAQAMVGLPIWPEDVRRQLEAINDWEHTLLIPAENAQKVTVNGNKAVLLDNKLAPTLIWQDNGMIYSIEDDSGQKIDLVKIAQSLR